MKQKIFLPTPTVKIITFTFSYLLLGYLLAPLPSEFYQQWFHCSIMKAEMLHQYGFFLFHFLCFLLGFLIFKKNLKIDFLLIKKHLGKCLIRIGFTLLLMIIGSMILSFIQTENQAAVDSLLHIGNPVSNFLFLLTVVLIGPFNEELLFREVIIGQFGLRLPKGLLVCLSSLLFGFIHISSLSQWPQALPYIWNGLMLSLLYVRNKDNVLLSFGAHALNNFLSVIL